MPGNFIYSKHFGPSVRVTAAGPLRACAEARAHSLLWDGYICGVWRQTHAAHANYCNSPRAKSRSRARGSGGERIGHHCGGLFSGSRRQVLPKEDTPGIFYHVFFPARTAMRILGAKTPMAVERTTPKGWDFLAMSTQLAFSLFPTLASAPGLLPGTTQSAHSCPSLFSTPKLIAF